MKLQWRVAQDFSYCILRLLLIQAKIIRKKIEYGLFVVIIDLFYVQLLYTVQPCWPNYFHDWKQYMQQEAIHATKQVFFFFFKTLEFIYQNTLYNKGSERWTFSKKIKNLVSKKKTRNILATKTIVATKYKLK